jgi:hypothetical protein
VRVSGQHLFRRLRKRRSGADPKPLSSL